jgi:quinoprotein glucose dehydrogenase
MIEVMRIMLAVFLTIPAAFPQDWGSYGGDPGGTRYSTRTQITRDNVGKLKQVWTFHTGALVPQTRLNEKAAFEATPILVDGTLYLQHSF